MQNLAQPIDPFMVDPQRLEEWIDVSVNRPSRKTKHQQQHINADTSQIGTIPTKSVVTASSGLIKAALIMTVVALVTILAVAVAVPTVISVNSMHNTSSTVASTTASVTSVSVTTTVATTTLATTVGATTAIVSTTSVTTSTTSTSVTTSTTTTTKTTSASSTGASSTSTSSTSSTSTTPTPYTCGNMTVLYGYDLPGSDLMSNSTTYSGCCAWCLSLSNCVSYTFALPAGGFNATNACYLKYAIPSATSSSGYCSAHY